MTDARSALLDEAIALESKGLEWNLSHVAAFLGIARSTVYATPWLVAIAKPAAVRGLRWNPAEVRNRGALPVATPHKPARRLARKAS